MGTCGSIAAEHELDELTLAEQALERAQAIKIEAKAVAEVTEQRLLSARTELSARDREHTLAQGELARARSVVARVDEKARALRAQSYHRAFVEVLAEKVGVDVCDALRQMARERVKAGRS